MKILRYVLLGVAALTLVAALAIAYLVYTFDPRDYAPRLVEIVREKTGRTLGITGDIGLSVWPDLGIRLGAVSLSERGSDERFAEIENARLTVKLVPLLSRKLIIDELRIAGARVRVTRFADGRLNIDDLLRGDGATPTFDVAHVKIERSALSYRDLGTGREYDVSGIEVETGRLANAVKTPVKAAWRVADAQIPFDVTALLEGELTPNPGSQRYALDAATLDLKGHVAAMTSAAVQVKGRFVADLKNGEFRADALRAALRAATDGKALDASLTATALLWQPARAYAEAVTAVLRSDGTQGIGQVELKTPRLEREADAVSAAAAEWVLDWRGGGRTLRLAAASPIAARITERTIELTALDGKVTASGAPFPARGSSGTFTGLAVLDGVKHAARASLRGRIDESRMTADLRVAGFATPVYTFAIAIDQLDADRYARATPVGNSAAGALDAVSLASFPATGTLTIGVLKTAGVKARNVRLAVKP